ALAERSRLTVKWSTTRIFSEAMLGLHLARGAGRFERAAWGGGGDRVKPALDAGQVFNDGAERLSLAGVQQAGLALDDGLELAAHLEQGRAQLLGQFLGIGLRAEAG